MTARHSQSGTPGRREGGNPSQELREQGSNEETIRWGRFVDPKTELDFQKDRSYSMAMMGSVCFPIFTVSAVVSGIVDHILLRDEAFWRLVEWRGLTILILAAASWYTIRNRKRLMARVFSAIISGVIITILCTNIPISLIYLEELGRSDRLLQISLFSLIALVCHPGSITRVLALACLALLSIFAIDFLGSVPLKDTAHDCLSLLIVVGVAIGGNLVWCTRSREAYLVTLRLATSEAELRKLREVQAQSAKQALERRDAQWSAVVEQAPVVVLTVDRTGVVAFANPKAGELGFEVGQVLDASSSRIDGGWLRSRVGDVFSDKRTHSFDLVLGTEETESSHWTFYAAPIGPKDPAEQVMLVGLDSTEAWRLRFELRRKSRESTLGSFVTSISHDFNNLLMIIVGSAEMLEFDARLPSSSAPLVHSILDAAQKSDDLVRRMLRFVRGTPSRPEIHDVNQLIEDMGSLLRYVAGAHNRLHLERSPEPLLIRIDKTEFEQILINLCSNARSAIEDSGEIFVVTRRDAQGRVSIIVRDSGCGMSQDVQARMFEPYFTTRAEYGGSGVGLATVRGLVESANGHIEVRTAPNQGTEMRIAFDPPPQKPAELNEPAPFDVQALGSQPRTALVVDENPETRVLARSMLERMGCSTFIASNSQSAIEQARDTGQIDLLITDFRHDLQDAMQLDSVVRSHHPGLATVFSTGHIDSLKLLAQIQEHQLVVLQKPYTSTEMANAIERASS